MERKPNTYEAAYYIMEDCLISKFDGKLQPSIALERTILPLYAEKRLAWTTKNEARQLFFLKPILAEICDLPLRWGMLSYNAKPEDAFGCIFHYPFNSVNRIEIGCGLIGEYDKISFIFTSIDDAVSIRQRFPFSYCSANKPIGGVYEWDSFYTDLLSGNRQNILDIACVLTDLVNCVLLFPENET